MFDGETFGAAIVEAVRDHYARATAPLLARLAELEARAAIPGAAGRDGVDGQNGKDGESVTLEQLQPLIKEAVAALPTPAAGRDGADGKDAAPVTREQLVEAILAMPDVLDEAVRRHLEANPPAAGRDGVDGKNGKDGESITVEQVEPLIAATVEKAFAAIPVPENGRDGVDGQDGRDGADGMKGDPGTDGVGLAAALIDRDNNLIVTLTDGSTRSLGLVVGRDGRDGVDGRDGTPGERGERGFSLDQFDTELKDDGRTLILKFVAGDTVESHEIPFPAAIYRGVYKDGEGYTRGDLVTWAGSLWHCDAETAQKPGEGSEAWTLAAKRGRDGKDGVAGKAGERGAKGEPGRDGRSYG